MGTSKQPNMNSQGQADPSAPELEHLGEGPFDASFGGRVCLKFRG